MRKKNYLIAFILFMNIAVLWSTHAIAKDYSVAFDLQFEGYSKYSGLFNDRSIDSEWTGSGTIINKDSSVNQEFRVGEGILILTNEHVIHNAFDSLRINLFLEDPEENASEIKTVQIQPDDIQVLNMDFYYDLGLVFVSKESLEEKYSLKLDTIKTLRLCSQAEYEIYAQVNETVFAVGSPKGKTHVSQKGSISKLREYSILTELDKPSIHVNAPINPGNSGGALLDKNQSCLLGVPASAIVNAEGMGYVIPLDQIINFLSDTRELRNNRNASRGYLFIHTTFFTHKEGSALRTPPGVNDGEIIQWIGEPYKKKYPLQELDIITSITAPDGKKYTIGANADHVQFVLYSYSFGNKFNFEIIRSGSFTEIPITTDVLPPYILQEGESYIFVKKLGVFFENIPIFYRIMREHYEEGVMLSAKLVGSPLTNISLAENAIVTQMIIRKNDNSTKYYNKITSVADMKDISWSTLQKVGMYLKDMDTGKTQFVAVDL